MTEEQLQAACTQWFWNEYPAHRRMLLHVDNNSANRITGAKKKALGVVSGPADLVLILNRQVVFIELKVGTNVQSDNQKDFESKVITRGHAYIVVRDLLTFKEIICKAIGK